MQMQPIHQGITELSFAYIYALFCNVHEPGAIYMKLKLQSFQPPYITTKRPQRAYIIWHNARLTHCRILGKDAAYDSVMIWGSKMTHYNIKLSSSMSTQ